MEEREKEKRTKVQPFLRPSGAAYKFDLGYFSYIKYGKTVVFVCNPELNGKINLNCPSFCTIIFACSLKAFKLIFESNMYIHIR